MINRKKTQRLYKEEGLEVRRRRSRRRAVGTRAPAPVLALPNQRWSLDFVHDQRVSGHRFRVLNVVDDSPPNFQKQWPASLRPTGSATQAIASTAHLRNNVARL